MIRRLALVLIAVVLVVPATGSAQRGPLPTAGAAYVFECHPSPTGACSPYGYTATFAFFGSIQFDGASRVGFWGLDAVVDDNGTFGPTPISDQPIGIPFPAGVCALDIFCLAQAAASPDSQMRSQRGASDTSASAGLISDIGGSCSGQGGFVEWDLTCDFVMPGGLSATRQIQVVFPTWDFTDTPCQFFCEPAFTDEERWGFYMRNIPGV